MNICHIPTGFIHTWAFFFYNYLVPNGTVPEGQDICSIILFFF